MLHLIKNTNKVEPQKTDVLKLYNRNVEVIAFFKSNVNIPFTFHGFNLGVIKFAVKRHTLNVTVHYKFSKKYNTYL